jgi:hypothetical protein
MLNKENAMKKTQLPHPLGPGHPNPPPPPRPGKKG